MFWKRKLKRNLLLQVRLKTQLNWNFQTFTNAELELHGKPFIDYS